VCQAPGASVLFQLADVFVPELALAAQFAPLLFQGSGNAEGGQGLVLPVQILHKLNQYLYLFECFRIKSVGRQRDSLGARRPYARIARDAWLANWY
jgi:hypothetical protein